MSNIDPRIIRARSELIMDHPFFGSLAMRLQVIATTLYKTMATDGRQLLYNAGFLDTITARQLLFVIAHEVMHCALNHHTRRDGRDAKLWNEACDYVINLILVKAGFEMPEGGLLDQQFEGLGAEAVFRILDTKRQQEAPSGDGSSQTENESEGPSDPGGCGEVIDAAPEHDEGALADQEAEWEVAVRQAVNIAKKQNAGTTPGFLSEVVADLANPRTDWRAVLRRFATPSNTKDYSWRMPNRRLMSQGYFTPGLISDGVNHVAILIDSSGSCDQDVLRVFGGEAQAALDEGGIDEMTVVFIDTRVNRFDRYVKGDQIDFTVNGRGGTAFSPAFAWLNENAPDVSAAIYFTDLECSDFGEEPHYPVLWAAYGDPRTIAHYSAQLPFGECVDLQN